MKGKGSSQASLDVMAKEKGFPSYAAMKAWNEKYRKPQTTQAPPPKRNFLQNLIGSIPNPMNYAASTMQKAVRGRKKKK
jgi:hypothetical protein